MVEQTLSLTQMPELEQHIDSCAQCRQAVAAALAKGATLGSPSRVAVAARTAEGVGGRDSDDEPFVPVVGAVSDRYVIERVLGRGGMGTVYLAHDLTLDRDVALKLHRAGSGNDRLHREAIAMAKLAHPNVVTVFEVATVDDRLYVAMEYVRGETLRGWLATRPSAAGARSSTAARRPGSGLAAAHAAGLVHRDFKPENVLVGDDGRPRVSDFGLARVGGRTSGAIADCARLGIARHADDADRRGARHAGVHGARAARGRAVDARCDQFAFCVVAWECLFGKRPFGGATLAALAARDPAPRAAAPARAATCPQRVRDVIERGLAADPRHATPTCWRCSRSCARSRCRAGGSAPRSRRASRRWQR